MRPLDAVDVKLLKAIQADAKLTTKELAAKVGLSPSPVFGRLKQLEADGYIKGYIAVLDSAALGNGLTVFCNIRLQQHTKKNGREFMRAIGKLDEIVECYNTSGDFDFMMKVCVRDMQAYQDFVLNKLGEISCIGNLHSIFSIGEVKPFCGYPIAAARRGKPER